MPTVSLHILTLGTALKIILLCFAVTTQAPNNIKNEMYKNVDCVAYLTSHHL